MKNIKNIVFFGTHELAHPALETLDGLGLEPKLIVTRPRVGLEPNPLARRPQEPPPHLVKRWAKERDIPLVISRRAAQQELHEKIQALAPDLLVVVDYGRPLPTKVIEMAARGALEVHPSLLPKLRGAHAIRAALGQGLRKTGVTSLMLEEEPWGGGILLSEEVEIGEEETFGELLARLTELSCTMLGDSLTKVDKAKKPKTRKQNPKAATKTPHITARHRRAPWQLSADEVYNRWRAHAPPGMTTSVRFQSLEIVRGRALPKSNAPFGETGTYLGVRSGKLAILCGQQTVFGIEEVRLPDEETGTSASEAAEVLGLRVGEQFI